MKKTIKWGFEKQDMAMSGYSTLSALVDEKVIYIACIDDPAYPNEKYSVEIYTEDCEEMIYSVGLPSIDKVKEWLFSEMDIYIKVIDLLKLR